MENKDEKKPEEKKGLLRKMKESVDDREEQMANEAEWSTTTSASISVGCLLTVQGDGASTDGRIKLNCSQNSHGVTIQAPPHSSGATYTLTLPDSGGAANQLLASNGAGSLIWVDNNPSLNAVLVALGVSSYVDNAAATTGGLSAGDVYYNTTDSKLTTVS